MKRKVAAAPLPTRFSGPGASPGFLLWKISNAWQRKQRAALQPHGLTHSQFVLLATATWYGGRETLTQARLSALSGVDAMTTSQLVRTLESAKLIERRDHPDDPRAIELIVTAAGKQKARAAVVAVEQADAAFFAPIGSSTKKLVELFSVLASSGS